MLVLFGPHKHKRIYISAIESVQRHAAGFVCDNFSSYTSVTEMLTNLQWPTLALRRNKLKAITMIKIINHLIDIPTDTALLVPVASGYHT